MSNTESNCNTEHIIRCIKETIQNGEFGIDYTIAKRDKNEYLKQKYNVNDKKIIQILMDLETENFIKKKKAGIYSIQTISYMCLKRTPC